MIVGNKINHFGAFHCVYCAGAIQFDYAQLLPYGHIHDIVSYDDIYKKLGFRAIHVGVDTNNFMPISLDEAWNKSNILLEKLDEN